jgi:hypothetical protein
MADFETGTPMIINRVCGQDQTGTLYIGLARRSVRFRLQQLMRSLREPRQFRSHKEHDAGRAIHRNPLLKEKFPRECLAVRWAYDNNPQFFEGNLLAHYFKCFGEIPPLNVKRGYEQWIDD